MLTSLGKLHAVGAIGLLKILPEIIHPNLVEHGKHAYLSSCSLWKIQRSGVRSLSKEARTQGNEAPLLCLKPLMFTLGSKNNELDMQGRQLYFVLDSLCSISLPNTYIDILGGPGVLHI